MGSRVVLAMSGGVDSSVAAHLLKEQGHEVIGLFMRTGAHGDDPARRAKTCCSVTDALDARAVADRPFRVVLAGRPNAGKSSLFNALVGSRLAVMQTRPWGSCMPSVERWRLSWASDSTTIRPVALFDPPPVSSSVPL